MHHRAVTAWDAGFLRRSPLFAPLTRATCDLRLEEWPTLESLDALRLASPPIVGGSGTICRFVCPSATRRAYEQRIFQDGEIEVRPREWHDLFNALVWLAFPRAKSALNARHIREMKAESNGVRGRVRDALTILDEDGVIVATPQPDLLDLVRRAMWKELFWRRRPEVVAGMRFFAFGHALYHKALAPFIGLTGKAVLLEVAGDFLASPLAGQLRTLDERLGAMLSAEALFRTPQELLPLPVLGVPGWYPANTREKFYDDAVYFRTRKRQSARALA